MVWNLQTRIDKIRHEITLFNTICYATIRHDKYGKTRQDKNTRQDTRWHQTRQSQDKTTPGNTDKTTARQDSHEKVLD
jgi:hypothetical protein